MLDRDMVSLELCEGEIVGMLFPTTETETTCCLITFITCAKVIRSECHEWIYPKYTKISVLVMVDIIFVQRSVSRTLRNSLNCRGISLYAFPIVHQWFCCDSKCEWPMNPIEMSQMANQKNVISHNISFRNQNICFH